MKIGILGAGRIAAILAETMNKMSEVECYGVASRDLEKAKAFMKDHGFHHAFGSYEETRLDMEKLSKDFLRDTSAEMKTA